MKWLARSKPDQNHAVIDPWTAVHFSTGLAAGLMNAPPVQAMSAALAYEVAEQVMERKELGKELFQTAGPETFANVVTDMLMFAAGMWLGRRWNATVEHRSARRV
jgi:hypothetical protein